MSRAVRASAVTGLVLAVLPAAASAHARLISSSPLMESQTRTAPHAIVLRFSEAYNKSLSNARLFDSNTGLQISAVQTDPNPLEMVLRPAGTLPRAPYLIVWHTASANDGHVLDGSFGFGVGVPPQNPNELVSRFSGTGWLRIFFRTVMFIGLFFFAGGVLVPVLLRTRGPLGAWLLPAASYRDSAGSDAVVKQLDRRTMRAGWLAVAAAALTALAETADAGGGISPGTLKAYLLTNIAGISRLATIVLALGAVIVIRRYRRVAAAMVALAFLGFALGGHANSASMRIPAIVTDWVHLIAAAIWAGGIAQIASAWCVGLGNRSAGGRPAALREVLPRFGKIALPAFVTLAAAGAFDAVLQLGSLHALYATSYGQVLLVKIVCVAAMAFMSYQHAMRIRPRLAARAPRTALAGLERRHWRLLGGEAAMSWVVLLVVAVLVAFPLPPSQLTSNGPDHLEASNAVAFNSHTPASARRVPSLAR